MKLERGYVTKIKTILNTFLDFTLLLLEYICFAEDFLFLLL